MRILIIEDYEPLQKSLKQGLREAGYAVDATGDGEEGLWYSMSNEYDVIVLDLMLPKLDGISILKKLRKAGKQNHILILTAKDTLADKINGLDHGADDYLIKPFEFEEMLARIRALLRRSYSQKSPEIIIADLRIELTTKNVFRDDKQIFLTPREYALLEYIAMRAGQIVSRTEIWEHVYEFNSSATSNVVDVYVGYLRKKLNIEDKDDLIHTIRGQGYILEDKK